MQFTAKIQSRGNDRLSVEIGLKAKKQSKELKKLKKGDKVLVTIEKV